MTRPTASDHAGLARVVAGADVLAADALVGGAARDALDVLRSHSWLELVASPALIDDAAAVIERLAGPSVAASWREAIEPLARLVEHPAGDHPALAAAHHGGARHILSFDDSLRSAAAGLEIRARVEASVKPPDAFVERFDPAATHELVFGEAYPGPDRDPRA